MSLKQHFPCFHLASSEAQMVYLDNASTTQKPKVVIDAMRDYYERGVGNPGRGLHLWAGRSEQIWEKTRKRVAAFLGGVPTDTISLNAGTTQGIHQVAWGFIADRLTPEQEIWAAVSDHHSNLLPWRQLCKLKGAKLRLIPLDRSGQIDLAYIKKHANKQVALITCPHISNVLGVVNPIKKLAHWCKKQSIPLLIDAAQSAAHMRLDIPKIGGDFWVFSGHKMYGPEGIGGLYVAPAWHPKVRPFYLGGGSVQKPWEGLDRSPLWKPYPAIFEVGSLPVAAAYGLCAALDFIEKIGFNWIETHEAALLEQAQLELKSLPSIQLLYPAHKKHALCSFELSNQSSMDAALWLYSKQIAVRSGAHCAGPLHTYLKLSSGTIRLSFAVYNDAHDVAQCMEQLRKFLEWSLR